MNQDTLQPLNVTLIGAGGRMGQTLLALLQETPALCLTGAIVEKKDALVGTKICNNICYTDDLLQSACKSDVLIDFSLPGAVMNTLEVARQTHTPVVCGVTGLSRETQAFMADVVQEIPVFYSANMSLGIAVMTRAVELMAQALSDTDIEVLDLHHGQKKDSPSGTAIALATAAAKARKWEADSVLCYDRSAHASARPQQQIGVMSLRGGNACGTHTVFFMGMDETLSITHESTSRRVFAYGALKAAQWLVQQPPRLYGMPDLFKV